MALYFLVATLTALTSNVMHLPQIELEKNNVIWTTPSIDASGSMPIGNGEVVLNVWVEAKTGDLLFYIGRTDSLSEISRILKLGGIRIHLDPNPFLGAKDFKHVLSLHDGRIDVSGNGAKLSLYVDTQSNTIRVKGNSPVPSTVTATVICWRNAARTLPKNEQISAWSVHDAPFPLVESADVFESELSSKTDVTWYHRNENSVVPKIWENQSLTGLAGTFDPLLHRTFGGSLEGKGFSRSGEREIQSKGPIRSFDLQIATCTAVTGSVKAWKSELTKVSALGRRPTAQAETEAWWHGFWERSWVFVSGDSPNRSVPKNHFELRKGVDSNGGNLFPGQISEWRCLLEPMTRSEAEHLTASKISMPLEMRPINLDFAKGFTLSARIHVNKKVPGRIFDWLTAGQEDGFLFDNHPGDGLRLIVGKLTLTAPKCLKQNGNYHVAATYDAHSGEAAIYLDGKQVASYKPEKSSSISRGYILQRYVQACQGRGLYPIKFNGGYFTVEPTKMGRDSTPDWRNWGDCHWFQNVRHMYHPMLASGDIEMMEPFFRLYEAAMPLAESRTRVYHGAQGAYFPETMTVFGTYSGGDYGWNRAGHQPKDVDCAYWQYAWNQGPELVALMLDRWEYARDKVFLKNRLVPMAISVLKYFETRFAKDGQGKIILDPTQVVETYWHGVINDMPTTAGLIATTKRLCELPEDVVDTRSMTFFRHMRTECPDLPIQTVDGTRMLAPAQKFKNEISNVENGELYGVWPFQVTTLGHPALLNEAIAAYNHRLNHLDVGWGYDGNVAALLGLTSEASRILMAKCANSNPNYRWPATWGPNFDWLPDQNHGGNLLNTTHLMLLQAEPIAEGGTIRLLPSWPKVWDVDFKLHAPGNTVVHCKTSGGRIISLDVTPSSRKKDLVISKGWELDPFLKK